MTVDLGDTLTFKSDLYDKPPDEGGVLTNAASVSLTITLPDGTTVTPTVTQPPTTTGKYLYDYATTVLSPAGRYVGNWQFTMAGGKPAAYVETFDVGSAMVTVDEAVAHLRANGIITKAADLDYLQFLCFVATDAIERDLGRAMSLKTVVETFDGGEYSVFLAKRPVVSVTSVTELGTALSPTFGYVLNQRAGIVQRGSQLVPQRFWWGRQNIVVTYVAGYTSPPYIARKVALNAIQGMWQESQQAPHPALSGDFGGGAVMAAQGMLTPVEQGGYDALRVVGIG